MDRKNTMILFTAMILLLISANMQTVKSDASDCYDGCSTACVSYIGDSRRMARCDRKCSIRCSPDVKANGHLK